ncbi:hypothetical protein BpHYR1_033461 [Brachionus plicatilis]|uniref:Uncharacterized protein n=1 Tax=Brachionus plicatilis TaxID=10195 RepID=A0A3M7STH0_BRAPC|nr:hypothetical protein BpHYR1_033461 [Brachionus plicatilis]
MRERERERERERYLAHVSSTNVIYSVQLSLSLSLYTTITTARTAITKTNRFVVSGLLTYFVSKEHIFHQLFVSNGYLTVISTILLAASQPPLINLCFFQALSINLQIDSRNVVKGCWLSIGSSRWLVKNLSLFSTNSASLYKTSHQMLVM